MKLRTVLFVLATFIALTSSHARNANEVQPILIGSKAPEVSVKDETGKDQFLPDLLKGKSTVLVFYRGGWCPYCSRQMQALGESESELLELGYQIIAISPDSPEQLSSIEKDGELNYNLYSDSSFDAASAFGIDFTLDNATLQRYNDHGLSLEKISGGANKDKLPVPSVFLITPNNEISFVHVDPDHRFRLSSNLLLAAAKDGLEFHDK